MSAMSAMTRRKFLKRTGGATVAAFVAFGLTRKAEARVSWIDASNVHPSYEIRAVAKNTLETSSAAHQVWNGHYVRLTRKIKIGSSGTEWVSPAATTLFTLNIVAGVQLYNQAEGKWEDCVDDADEPFNGNEVYDHFYPHGAVSFEIVCASITKVIDPLTGVVVATTYKVFDKAPDDDEFDATFADEGFSGNVSVDLDGKDRVTVVNSGVTGVPSNSRSLEGLFEIRRSQ